MFTSEWLINGGRRTSARGSSWVASGDGGQHPKVGDRESVAQTQGAVLCAGAASKISSGSECRYGGPTLI